MCYVRGGGEFMALTDISCHDWSITNFHVSYAGDGYGIISVTAKLSILMNVSCLIFFLRIEYRC